MTYDSGDYLELAFRSVNCFADEPKPSFSELSTLLAPLLASGVPDIGENRVVRNVLGLLQHAQK